MPSGSNVAHPFNSHLVNGIHDVFDFKLWGNKVLVPANFNDAGRELWIFDPGTVNAIVELQKNAGFKIYPNPAFDRITVSISRPGTEPVQLSIENIAGQIVYRQVLTEEISSLNLSLPAGAYFVTLHQNGYPTNTQKLLVVK